MSGGPTAEKQPTQKLIMVWTSLGFIALLMVPALDYRFGWSRVPLWAVVFGNALVAGGSSASSSCTERTPSRPRRFEVAANQTVISTGPYAIVRHPMYANGLLYLVGTPLALGSYWGLVPFAAMLPFLIWRLLDEERFLAANLPGYTEYQRKVRHRLVPQIW
jgi:protein-S-isoprenylcysteine O-methyltransferase Ste14